MLTASVGQGFDASTLFLLIVLIFGVSASIFARRESERFLKANTVVFATTYDTDAMYAAIVKQVEEWHRQPFKPRRWSLASLRWWVPRFAVYRDERPRLYRVVDRYAGVITFELTPIEGGGTSVKVTHSPQAQALTNVFKSKLPIKVPPSLGKMCPSCKRIYPPSYTHCPYCGIALP